jgi:hypothetical protein
MYLYNSGQLVNLNGNPKIMAIVPMKSRQDVALPGTQRTCLHISSKQILQDSWLSHWENMGNKPNHWQPQIQDTWLTNEMSMKKVFANEGSTNI